MSLQELALKSLIFSPDLSKLPCGTIKSLLLKIRDKKIELEEYQLAIFLNKLITQLQCREFENVQSLIVEMYDQLPRHMLYVPHDYEALRERIFLIPIDTVYTKTDVVNNIKYLTEVFPEIVNQRALDELSYIDHQKFILDDFRDTGKCLNEAYVDLFREHTVPLRHLRGYNYPLDEIKLAFIAIEYTGTPIHILHRKMTRDQFNSFWAKGKSGKFESKNQQENFKAIMQTY